MFLADLPSGLLPICSIEHHIDLIPGASILNNLDYHYNPEEKKELQKQINQLMNKGLVCESLSARVFLVLLVPKKDGTWCMGVDS